MRLVEEDGERGRGSEKVIEVGQERERDESESEASELLCLRVIGGLPGVARPTETR